MLALCKAAPLLDFLDTASRLLDQISPYLLEAHTQVFAPSPFLRAINPSPWEALTYQLTRAILSIGVKHPSLSDHASSIALQYLSNCLQAVNGFLPPKADESTGNVELEESIEIAALTVSIVGFLDAVSDQAQVFTVFERLDLVRLLRQIFDENLMISVEGVFSSIRTSEASSRNLSLWKSYSKHYAASGRPLGAMLLQRGLMRLLVSCSSLFICSAEKLQSSDVFTVLKSGENGAVQTDQDASTSLLQVMSDIAVESMRLLEDGSDYLQLGSAWQQRLAFTVKAHTLHVFLNCMAIDEEIADVDILMSWLEDAMADPVQMADDLLASIVLDSMVVIARFSPVIAATLSRSLPRFVVQGGIKGETIIIAAQSLASILRMLSQDAIITGLYSLGNVLSAGSTNDRVPSGADLQNGSANSHRLPGHFGQHSTGSAISLDLSGEETTAAYGNIVRAIVTIAKSCKDERITALAQSILVQKLGRMSLAVDLQIIKEAATLATVGGPVEFKSLLKLYARLGHDAIARNNPTILTAVSFTHIFLSFHAEDSIR